MAALTMLMWLEDIEQLIDEHCSAYTGSFIQEILWRTLVCDCILVGTRATVEYKASYLSFRMCLLSKTIWARKNPLVYEKHCLMVGFGLLATTSLIMLSRFNPWCPTRLQGWSGLASIAIVVAASTWAFAQVLKAMPMVFDLLMINEESRTQFNEAMPFLSAIHRYHTSRKFFASENGRMGLLSRSACKGDHVFVFPGSSIPFVLRQCHGGYRVLGDCYVHGMMDGEGHGDSDGFESIEIV